MAGNQIQQALALLQEETGIVPGDQVKTQWMRHLELIRAWNRMVALVSEGDLAILEERHLVDALSLAPLVAARFGTDAPLLDIGAGGGFPAIPIKCLFPDMPITLVERSAKKVGFLHKVTATLGLEAVTILHGVFPEIPDKVTARVITARAVERPRQLLPRILQRMPQGCAFLCQSPISTVRLRGKFHVEHYNDLWRRHALRCGELHIITHAGS